MTPDLMLDDDVLTRLLTEAAESFPVPDVELEDVVAAPAVWKRRVATWTAVAAALVGGLLVVQSLGGSTPTSRSKVQAAPAAPQTTPPLVPAALPSSAPAHQADSLGFKAANTTSAATGLGSSGDAARSAASSPSQLRALGPSGLPATAQVPAPAAQAAAPAPAPFEDGAKIVKTGSIALIVGTGKVSTVEVKVEGIAAGAGGYVSSQKSQEYGDDPSSTVTVRVPVDKFEQVVAQVRDQVKNGVGKVDSASTSGQDVTASYADVNAQIQSLTAARERFLVILGRANTIGETLSVQQRVDSVQQQIDSLRGRLRVLKDQTSMGTLTVTVSEKPKAEVKPHVQSGLSKSWDNAQHGFTSGVESIISRSGKGLLVLIVAAVGLVVLRTGWRLARRRMV